MNLTEVPEIVNWPETYYVFIEKIGSFRDTAPAAWKTAHSLVAAISEHNQITGYMSLYKLGSSIYRAGFSLAGPPNQLPAELESIVFPGGKYSRFVLKGPYDQLGPANGRVMEIVKEQGIETRDDFNIEHYVTDPRSTPPEQTVTHILVPTA